MQIVLSPGQLVPLTIEKPASGGRMIARVDGQVVLVGGAIPGERVTARIERVGKGVAYATVAQVEEPSLDRRDPFGDLLCGGCLYAHISYPRQLDIKAQVIGDGFARIGHLTLPSPLRVAGSPEDGYRMRARLHVRHGHAGFFREGTHDVCDARLTRQLLPQTCDVVERIVAGLRSHGIDTVREVEVSENVDASERVVHLDAMSPTDLGALTALGEIEGLSGLTISSPSTRPAPADTPSPGNGEARRRGVEARLRGGGSRPETIAGDPHVTDVLSMGNDRMTLRRHVLAFFQGNRYLLPQLVAHVASQIDRNSSVIDLYAGTGLFAAAAAIARGARVTAVEGDRTAAQDLDRNAMQTAGAVRTVHQPVEAFTARAHEAPDALIVDPPRTGMSRETMDGVIRLRGRRIVYVSCDVATLARDSRRLVDAGYAIQRVDAFDLFPNTPHVETIVVFRI